MSFDLLHPALQHHIVNSLGWRELRPFQEAVIPRILSGENLIVLAPTAGGKTEASCFPTLSRMLSENWTGLSVLYICPIKALLNNLDVRLQRYCTLVGRRSALWHGDVNQSARKKILREPPDLLLTTPESLEVMLVSPTIEPKSIFVDVQMVIIDEIHAFAGDDRGWHLLSVLERIEKVAGRELQRIGLSATVGNPETLVNWLAGASSRPKGVYLPTDNGGGDAEVKLDYVGSLENAAVVISRLHQGEKRLVFVDSRARAETLATSLRQLDVTTFVTHSSLSQEQRHQAEEAFATRDDCVIVATSVLELGVDVGDLDRVIQIDSPATVASFLQRMGRTGRRSGILRNCLFLATKDQSLIQAAALIDLWNDGYVEPIEPPAEPYHILAQQLMALALQTRGVGRRDWFDWVKGSSGFSGLPRDRIEHLVDWMLAENILWDDEGILWLGTKGQEDYGRRNFMELFSVFMSPPLFSVLNGRRELGYVDEMTFLGKCDGPRVLLLGGRAWKVNHIDWQRRIAYVELTDSPGRTRWKGGGQGLSFAMCQSIKRVLAADDDRDFWSKRAIEQINESRVEFPWLNDDSTVIVIEPGGELRWWNFAGSRANATLANELAQSLREHVAYDSFALKFEPSTEVSEVESALSEIRVRPANELWPAIDERAIDGLKFSDCLPPDTAIRMLSNRLRDSNSIKHLFRDPMRNAR